jgi:hypothetical protein
MKKRRCPARIRKHFVLIEAAARNPENYKWAGYREVSADTSR